jgi:hypothetical protein
LLLTARNEVGVVPGTEHERELPDLSRGIFNENMAFVDEVDNPRRLSIDGKGFASGTFGAAHGPTYRC